MASTDLKNILIIDDDLDICYLLRSVLKQSTGLVASYVNSLGDAKQKLNESSPNLIFLDNHLPDGFGLDFLRFLRSTNPDAKIVMITAHDDDFEQSKAFEEGADFFISKPFSKQVIHSTLNNLLN